ncbi:MAG: DUF192 domain-containing protein [Chloroflexi bacterium]|nr:DUF192 domain-containing protein [Chloroflexota bacterium]
MRSIFCVIVTVAIVGVLTAACDRYDSQTQPTPVVTLTRTPEPTPTATPAPSPSPIIVATQTAVPLSDPLEGFILPDPETGVWDVHEALVVGQQFQLEVARTSSERALGLMGRTSLPQEAAMLFVFESEEYRSFWMKNTLIPLDILFLDARGVVVDVQTMQPQIGVSDDALKIYRSAQPARYALEMNADLADALGIMPGAQILFR